MQLRQRDRTAGSGPDRASRQVVGGRVLVVASIGEPRGGAAARLVAVAVATGRFEVRHLGAVDRLGSAPAVPADVDVVVLDLDSLGAPGVAATRELHRRNPAWRLVVVASTTDGFEEAFEHGAHAWIGAGADDRTIEVAVTGERPRPPSGARAPWRRGRRRQALPER
jgi:CheY-like chemotaxis protein